MRLTLHTTYPETDMAWTFRFRPDQSVTWAAGQSIRLEVPAGYNVHERRFTISSAPYERDICITTRISDSPFKQALRSLQPGDAIDAGSIEGAFVWQPSSRPLLLCASGIGITPYFSMLKQRAHDKQPLRATLLYANRRPGFVFERQLRQLQTDHPQFSVIFLDSQRLTADIVQQQEYDGRLIYLSGPSAMVDQVGDELLAAGVSPDRLRRDWFTGKHGWEGA